MYSEETAKRRFPGYMIGQPKSREPFLANAAVRQANKVDHGKITRRKFRVQPHRTRSEPKTGCLSLEQGHTAAPRVRSLGVKGERRTRARRVLRSIPSRIAVRFPFLPERNTNVQYPLIAVKGCASVRRLPSGSSLPRRKRSRNRREA